MAEILNRFAYAIAAEVDPRAFREFERQGIAAGSAIKSNFAGIQSVINDALSVPRNAFGGLDLGIAKLREMERDLESVAVASREVARATKQAEIAEGQTNRERVASIRNANAFATVKQQELDRLRQEIALQERIQAELNQTASATDRVIAANRGGASAQDELARSVRGQRQAYIQANQQFQDIAISLAGGQRASTVLAQQLPQLGFALKDASGLAGRFGTLLSGPAGIGIIGALLVLGPLIDEGIRKLFGYGEAADEAANATKKLEEAQKAEIEAAGKLADIAGDEEKRLARAAELLRIAAFEQRNLTKAKLEAAIAEFKVQQIRSTAPGQRGEIASLGLPERSGAIGFLTGELAKTQKSLDDLTKASTQRLQQIVVNRTKLLLTPEGRINAKFDQQEKDARGSFGNNFAGLSAEIKRINSERQRQLDLINQTSKAETSASTERRRQINAEIPTVAQLSKVVREAFPGSRVTSGVRTPARNAAVGGKPNSRHLTGQAIDFVAPSGVSIGDVRNEFRQRGIELREAIDEGDHFHIAVDKGKVELQGYADAARDAQRATKELNADLASIIGQFDQGADLAAKFDEQIAQIAALRSGGRITADQAGQFTSAARNALFAANDNLNREVELAGGERLVRGYASILEGAISEASDGLSRELEDSIVAAADKALGKINRDGFKALDGIARQFGSGPASLLASLSKRASGNTELNPFLNALGKGQREANEKLADLLNNTLDKILSRVPDSLAGALGGALAGAQTGGQIAGIGKSLGIKTSRLGGQLGGAAGSAIGGPVGELIGGALGSIVGGLFKKTPKGSVAISNTGSSFSGSGKLRSGLTATGDSVTDTLSRIAEQLGGNVGAFSASIRQKKNSFFVGNEKFGSAEEAASAATLNLIKSGVIAGLDRGTQELLAKSKDINAGLRKALDFQGALDRIKETTDPLGLALSKINREFGGLRATFTEAGASAEQFAGLAALEAKERKAALDNITASLRDLQRENSFGDTGRSLRDRQAAALAAFNPLEARVKAGDATAFDQFADVGRQLRDINREIFGSQSGYFEFLDRLQATTNSAIAGQENIAGLNSTAAPVVSAVEKQTDILVGALRAMNDNNLTILTEISAKLSASGGGGVVLRESLNFS